MTAPVPHRSGFRNSLSRAVLLGLLLFLTACPFAAAGRSGEQIYRKQCASCHGASGEGSAENYPQPLTGPRSVAQLARYIAKRMPEDAPGTCVGEDADRVAAYIHETFYSPAAQARNKPPRLELSRLTVRQLRNAAADLVGSFRSQPRPDGRQGLRAEYSGARRFRRGKPALERIDPTVQFDFGTASPVKDIDPHAFSIRWQGSLLAPETGEYEFTVRTDHATRLWLNDPKRPLIDAWVKSGKDTEHRGSIFLLGGRAYPLRLEFSKAKQGVDDSKNEKKRPSAPAMIALEWKLPQRPAEVVPARNLLPVSFPESFVLTTAFPPDDRSMGYERGTSISRAWEQATTDAAIETAGYVAAHVNELAGTRDGAPDRDRAVRDFCRRFVERAFRRPLTDEQKRIFIDRQLERGPDLDTGVKRMVLLALKSPRFLYREVGSGPDAYDTAARLSFALWDSPPDPELLEAARTGKLATHEQVEHQAERMLADLRARAKLHDFFLRWLKVEQVPDLAKDPKQLPGFDAAVALDLRTSLELFLEDVLTSEAADFRRLLLDESVYLNGRLAKLYGANLPADAPFHKVSLDPGKRAGILSHPYLLATFAYTASSSPIHRGVFLARNVLGQTLRPPPEAFTPFPADLHPSLTTRERVALQTKPQACASCHGMINPLGFTLESFDAIGRFRDRERGRPVDSTGSYLTRTGEKVTFSGVRPLASFLASSPETHDAFVQQMFHYLIKQPIRAFGPYALADLRQSFVAKQFNVRKLVVEIAATAALPTAPTSPSPRRKQEK
jgi:cytochrome c553